MYSADWFNHINRSGILPSLHEKKSVKSGKKWQRAIMDSFEYIGMEQYRENMSFWDYYRMVEGQMSQQELSEVVPHLKGIEQLLDGVGIPTFLKHYDILGTIINALVGKYIDLQDKFHVVDTGEIAESEYLRLKNDEIKEYLNKVIETEINMHMAKNGFDPNGKEFSSPEEQQAFMAQLDQFRNTYTPQSTKADSEKSFKTLGVQWGEATMEHDRERFNMLRMEKEEFKDYLLTGRCFREYKLGIDRYYPKTWSPKNTFISKEIDVPTAQHRSYIGRLHFYLPSEIIREMGHKIPPDMQKKLMGGSKTWNSVDTSGLASGSIDTAIKNNFNQVTQVPFSGFFDYNFALGIQDELGIPMGTETALSIDGTSTVRDRFLPRMYGDPIGRYNGLARILRNDFEHSPELCQVTECYFIAYDLIGYLTYENEIGRKVTVEVTEDILDDFLKENNIKQTFKESYEDLVKGVEDLEPNTLKWYWGETTYEGIKIQSPNLDEPIVIVQEAENQIQGDSPHQRLLPVAGFVGKSIAVKIAPYQAQYNLCMNQIWNMLEKEIGVFFLMDVNMIPSEFQGQGSTEDAMATLVDIARDIGVMGVGSSEEGQPNLGANKFQVYDVSFTKQIANRIELSSVYQRKAWEVIGINGSMVGQPSKYETAEGVRINQEVSFAQVSEIYEDFSFYKKGAWDLHLSVAQFAQKYGKDNTVTFTKSDGSMAFLQLDENFPLRRLGVQPSEDRRRRKELEQFKNYLLNNNTMASDTIEFAKLLTSDTMREALEISQAARKARLAEAEQDHRRNLELEEKRGQNAMAIEDRKDQREFKLQTMEDEKDVYVAQLNALGRASDKQSDVQGISAIQETAKQAQDDVKTQHQIEKDVNNLNLKEKIHSDNVDIKMQELALKAKELNERIKQRQSNERVSAMNKN